MVLGVQWLGTLGPILWDFAKHTLCFTRSGKRVSWIGTDTTPGLASAALMSRDGDLLDTLLEEFDSLFAEPQGLPPERHLCHRIRLKQGAGAIAVRPYRYAHAQKDELERQCDEMLRLGIIRPSTSAFSSPVLLVRKKDGTWRFCIDFRALNAKTVRDMFPIPVVDALLDELKGACFFTKLDLASGYHQVRMHPDDIHKTAFRTHHGHFEFVVMPFGLTNAPSTFQALMNKVLRPFLRKFVLVFFDDILIYSSYTEHLRHVRVVLSVLRDHSLLLKRSKCSFAERSVAYLGHIISADGVAMDPSKIEAVQSLASTALHQGIARLPRAHGLLPPLYQWLRRDYSASDTTEAFVKLKNALTSGPVLQLPDFTMGFIVNCDASGSGFGAVLHQDGGPIAFFSRAVAPNHAKLAAYERELIGLVKAVRHWVPICGRVRSPSAWITSL